MESVFIAVLDLGPDANIKFCSDSIEDILGYSPHDVRGQSCWKYFHRDEVIFAQSIHSRGIELDKAAVLNYCRIKHKDGSWIGCECVFTVVHDVLVASISIYKRGPKSTRRALEGANVRRIFSSSPRDPRYHMLSYLSDKFYDQPKTHTCEPRAALFLNRFTRTSTIMFATGGVSKILGLEPEQITGKSFYYCIAESCLQDAVKCLESAKSNDSIAYLRFWYRNPLQSVSRAHSVIMDDSDDTDSDEEGGVRLRESSRSSVEMRDATPPQVNGVNLNQINSSNLAALPPVNEVAVESPRGSGSAPDSSVNGSINSSLNGHSRTLSNRISNEPPALRDRMYDLDRAIEERVTSRLQPRPHGRNTQSSSGNSTDLDGNSRDAIFDRPELQRSNSSHTSPDRDEDIEVEAVVSCTSDGLVVVLRRAHPLVPHVQGLASTQSYARGLFASPWATDPIMPQQQRRVTVSPQTAFTTTAQSAEAGFMAAIRDVAVFAWSLTGINGSLVDLGIGKPVGEAIPPGGLPIYDPNAPKGVNDHYNGFSGSLHRPLQDMSDSGILNDESSSSDEEVLWKREPTISGWRRPKRRAHVDAFGADEADGIDGQGLDGSRKRPSNGK